MGFSSISLKRLGLCLGTVALLVISFSVFYYYVVYMPQKNESERIYKEQKAKEKEEYLINCSGVADKAYLVNWAGECGQPPFFIDSKTGKMEINVSKCALPLEIADRLEKSYQVARNECYKKVDILFK